MKLLLDTNVVLDLLMDRAPHADAAAALFTLVEGGTIGGYLCATTVTTVFYLVAKAIGTPRAHGTMSKLMTLFEIAPVNRQVLESALAGDFADFEDAVLYEAACLAGAHAIVTRNGKDFKNSRIPVYEPADVVKVISEAFLAENQIF